MRLIIENLAKIKYANIYIDGITVIAGVNNTGKSTVGKVLYATFNSMYHINEKIEGERKREIYRICRDLINNLKQQELWANRTMPLAIISRRAGNSLYDQISGCDSAALNLEIVENCLMKVLGQYDKDFEKSWKSEYFEDAAAKILSRITSDDDKVSLELITRFFQQIFDSQIECVNSDNKEPRICLEIKNKKLTLQFERNECVSEMSNFNILHEAFFIDDPFVIDDLANTIFPYVTSTKGIRDQLADRLRRSDNQLTEGIFEAVAAKEGLQEIYEVLNQVTDGNIIAKNGDWRFKPSKYAEPISLDNLSAGLKSFVIIKILLERGILKEKDVLVLDEPEIHLHPDWQLKYAEIIVLLQKKFDLSIVVTTHSRDFLEAIELYSKKYEIDSKCRYYLSEVNDGAVIFEDVTGSLNKIYSQMVTASMLLDQLRYCMADENE